MPTYEYACDACHKSFELEQRITEDPVKKCANCGEMQARRMISGGTFLLKGSGWYADGYSGKSNAKSDGDGAAKSESANKGETKAETKSEPKAETKTETKSEPKAETKTASSSAD
jgi:putative FmdB family regulatory protein